ncbi:MAG: Rieske (2Fe-2S) protein [Gemmatimonadota bacterium]
MSDFVTVARVGDIPEAGLLGVSVNGREICLVRSQGKIYALEDRCSHEEFPLSNGDVTDGEITCALHGARFDLSSGTPRALPAVTSVRTYEVRVEGEDVQVKVES